MAPDRGTTLVVLGIGLFVATMAVGAVTAPSRNIAGTDGQPTPTLAPGSPPGNPTPGTGTSTATATPTAPRTLVGMQGEWIGGGSVFMLSGSEEMWRESSAGGYFEVEMLPDGTVLAGFANAKASDCGPLSSPCGRTGFRHIDPTGAGAPEIISEYSFPVGGITNSEVHAVDRIAPGEYVFTDMHNERIVVVENGTAVWSWNASSRYEEPPNPSGRDWLHINDVDVIGEDRFLVSVRNANQILVVERGGGVVEVINEDDGNASEASCRKDGRLYPGDDGEVTCGDPGVIVEQHNPQWIGPGAVLVADSKNDRVVELHRTENGSWEPAWVVREAGGIELWWPRDADRLPNGNTLITDTFNKRVVEVDENGNAVWSVGTKKLPYEADRLPFGEMAGRYDGPGATPTNGSTATPTNGSTATPANGSTATPTPLGSPLPTAGNGSGDLSRRGSDIPGLSLAVAGIQGEFTWVPFWFREFHLGVTVVSLLLVVAGGVDTARGRWDLRERLGALRRGR
ncbi:MAG: aryl-sulfate sulfotransferase [Haloarculaceae archaeon]